MRLGHSVQYIGAMELISALAKAQAQHALEARLTQDTKSRLLMIDEPGYLPREPNAAYLFFQLISRCDQRGSVLIISNRPVLEWVRCLAIKWSPRRSSIGCCATAMC